MPVPSGAMIQRMKTNTPARRPGRPPIRVMPERIPDTPENVARALMQGPPKEGWDFMKPGGAGYAPHAEPVDLSAIVDDGDEQLTNEQPVAEPVEPDPFGVPEPAKPAVEPDPFGVTETSEVTFGSPPLPRQISPFSASVHPLSKHDSVRENVAAEWSSSNTTMATVVAAVQGR